jgi:hypothetical protein
LPWMELGTAGTVIVRTAGQHERVATELAYDRHINEEFRAQE